MDTVTEAGVKVIWGPGDDNVEDKETVPENPLRLVKVTVTVPVEPRATVDAEGFRAILKSGFSTVTETVIGCVPEEPVPVTVTE